MALVYGPQYSTLGAFAGSKMVTFVLTLALAALIYTRIVRRAGPLLSGIRAFKFTFNQITVALTLFFLSLVGYAGLSI